MLVAGGLLLVAGGLLLVAGGLLLVAGGLQVQRVETAAAVPCSLRDST